MLKQIFNSGNIIYKYFIELLQATLPHFWNSKIYAVDFHSV